MLQPISALCSQGMRILCVVFLCMAACAPLEDKPASMKWHELYVPIEEPEAKAFLAAGIELLQSEHGSPEIPIREVLIRQSIKREGASRYRAATGFSKTEVVDPERGVFCIYLEVDSSHERFYYLLGHEIGHLLRPYLIGVAKEERFCNEFSRRLCRQQNRPWEDSWENRQWVRRH